MAGPLSASPPLAAPTAHLLAALTTPLLAAPVAPKALPAVALVAALIDLEAIAPRTRRRGANPSTPMLHTPAAAVVVNISTPPTPMLCGLQDITRGLGLCKPGPC
jgi:hypothetical protein